MTGGGRIDHDQVGGPVPLELFDLAEHQDVADAGNRRRNHVDHARADQALRDSAEAMILEVFDQCVVRRDASGPHRALLVAAGRLKFHLFVAQVLAQPEGSRDARLAF